MEHSGGLVGVPGVLLVALRGFIRFWVALGAVSGKIREILGSQNGAQNEKNKKTTIYQNFDASWGRFLERFLWILEGQMEPSWHKKRTKNRIQLRNAHFTKKVIKPIEF